MRHNKKTFFVAISMFWAISTQACLASENDILKQLHQDMQKNFDNLRRHIDQKYQETEQMHQEIMNTLERIAAFQVETSDSKPEEIAMPNDQFINIENDEEDEQAEESDTHEKIDEEDFEIEE